MWTRALPSELTLEMLEMIRSSDPFDSSGNTVDDIITLLAGNKAQIHIFWTAPAKGIVISQVLSYKTGRELFIWRVAGKGMLSAFEEVDDLLLKLAKKYEVDRLRTYSQNHRFPVMLARMQNHGWNAVSLEMVKNLTQGE